MATKLDQSFTYDDTTLGKTYQPVTQDGTDAGEIVLAAVTTDMPLGVLAEDVKARGQSVGVLSGAGQILKGVAGATAIAIGDRIGVEAEGKFSPLTNPAAFVAGAPKWCWGIALSATSADGEIVKFFFMPSIIHTAD